MERLRRRDFLTLVSGAALSAVPRTGRTYRSPNRILYFIQAAGYRHDVLPISQAVFEQLGRDTGLFDVATTEDASTFTTANLERYSAVCFFTSGELLVSDAQKAALLGFVRSGGGFVGIHSAAATFSFWPDYLDLIGGRFNGHPWHQLVTIEVTDPDDPLVGVFGRAFEIEDEIYQIGDFDYKGSRVLLRLDSLSVDLSASGVQRRPYGWPLAWTRMYGDGRVFYSALGHEAGVWRDPRYQQILTNAIRWTARW